ncbi:MAG TPA: exodeoxyribonuclease V subunit gamma, partial [Acidimicrobiales bacterium]
MLHVHRAERADGLVAGLADLLATPLPDPMVTEVVSVPTRGIERWLSQQLAGRLGTSPGREDGVCANVDFPFPATLVGGALACASGVDPDNDPWTASRSVWPLLEVVDASLLEPWLAPFADHLRQSAPVGEPRRFAAVRHVADLFDRYGVHRPELLRSWAGGDDQVPAESAWQPALWRRLRERIAAPSLAERLPDACRALREDATLVELPDRLSLFGLTRLPASYVDVLAALAAERDVHLFLLHPSAVLWDRVAAQPRPPRPVHRRDDPTAGLAVNPLLASWGRDAREMQLVIAGADAPTADHHQPVHHEPTTLLARLQAGVWADRTPTDDAEKPLLGPADRSLRLHDCHGRARQVEVLRDDIRHLLASDPTLEPRDVIVMCPDIEAYAPLIGAVFGSGAEEDEVDGQPALRVRLADRSLRQTNPVLGVVALLLDLASSRMTASQVLDLAGREPVRRRFGFDDDDLERLTGWVAASGIRWGLDAAHRAPFKLDSIDAGTWHAGLDRTLVGVAVADVGQRTVAGVVPLDDVDSGDIDLAGRWAELVDRLATTTATFSKAESMTAWADVIATAADRLCATTEGDAWQRAGLGRLLDAIVDEAGASPVPLALADVQALLAERLRGRPTRANFRTGHLTVCTLVPMRSVPHRVVCLLGLDDGAFPRGVERDGDDLILADPHVGDRDARSEDRQLLLDALLAATDHLVITYSGRDERTNLPRPPAVPVGELFDVVDRTVRTAGGGAARRQVIVRHPLQPFDPRNFEAGELGEEGPFSFDGVNLEGARALGGTPLPAEPFLAGPLPALEVGAVELDDLERFVRHPVGAFLRQRFSISLGDWSTEVEDALPVELDGLERWRVGERILNAHLAGDPLDACFDAERARG